MDDSIIIQLKGGLGNQMFQYAAGRALSLHRKASLLLDIASYEPKQAKMFALDAFNIEAELATSAVLQTFHQGILSRILRRVLPPGGRTVYKEPHFHFDKNFLLYRAPLYMKGYWQSWRYFQATEAIIRSDFRFREKFAPAVEAKARVLQNSNSVAMHFRRGDYTSTEAVNYHGICGPEYYQQAVEWMMNKLPDSFFYIFTNDPEWVRDNLPENIHCEILSGTLSHTQFEDLYLMSQCRHQIIANSSFSWWAAWLNNFGGKQVVAPAQWFAETKLNTTDLVPESWKRL